MLEQKTDQYYLEVNNNLDPSQNSELLLTEGEHYVAIEDNTNTTPSFRVMIGAEADGLHLMTWPQGADLNEDPHINICLAGWSHG